MSGGSLDYIQNQNVEDFVNSSTFDESLTAAAQQLAEYGELGEKAKLATEAFLKGLQEERERHQLALQGLEDKMPWELKMVWKQLDYEGSNDVGKEDVRKELEKYNASQS